MAVSSAYVVAGLWSFWHVFGNAPRIYPDTVGYEPSAAQSVWTLDFWAGHNHRAPGLPLFWKLLPGSTAIAAPVAQWIVSLASWLILAFVVSTFVRQRELKVVGFALVLAFSLTPMIGQWDGTLLSESLSLSLMVLLVAALLALVRSPSPRNVAFVLVTALLSVAVKDQSAFLALLLLLPIAAALAFGRKRQAALVVGCGVILIFFASSWASNRRGWEIGLGENVAIRVLPSLEALQYFEARGMPVRFGLWTLLLYNRTPPDRFDQVPQLADFRSWAAKRGRSTYASYLLSHPDISIGEPLRNLALIVAPERALPEGLDFFRPVGFRDSLPGPVEQILYPDNGWLVVAWMGIAAAMSLALALDGWGRRFWLVPAICLASTLPNALFIWNADALGRDRHSVPIDVLGRLSMWMLLLFAIDAVLIGRRSAEDEASPPSSSDAKPARWVTN